MNNRPRKYFLKAFTQDHWRYQHQNALENTLHDDSFRDIKESLRAFMKRNRKKWIKPAAKYVPIFFECTCYAAAV
jgi:hypothetical protein